MSYATTPHYEAEILSRNRLTPSPEPTMGNNPGRNMPLNRTDDNKGYQQRNHGPTENNEQSQQQSVIAGTEMALA